MCLGGTYRKKNKYNQLELYSWYGKQWDTTNIFYDNLIFFLLIYFNYKLTYEKKYYFSGNLQQAKHSSSPISQSFLSTSHLNSNGPPMPGKTLQCKHLFAWL